MGGLVLLMRSVARDEARGLDSFLGFFLKSWSVDLMEGKMMASERCPHPSPPESVNIGVFTIKMVNRLLISTP